MENKNENDTIFTKIDPNIKERALLYTTSSKIIKREETNTLRALIENALEEYMMNHPILENQETAN